MYNKQTTRYKSRLFAVEQIIKNNIKKQQQK